MALTTMLVVVLAAMSSCATAETTCGPCKCYDGDHLLLNGLKVADCQNVDILTSVAASLPADIQGLYINEGSITKLAESQFKSYRQLQEILIFHNKISQIEKGAFRYLTNVTYIDLFDNAITELLSDFLTHTPNITVVNLEWNKIKRLQTNLFRNLKYLKNVWLQDNEITTIEEHCFNNVPQLEEIRLEYNKLISLDVNFIDHVNSLKMLLLKDNPWYCDASLCGVLDVVERGALWGDDPAPTCTTPQNMTGKLWSKELLTELCPRFNLSSVLSTKPRQLNHLPTDLPTDLVQLNLTVQNKSRQLNHVPSHLPTDLVQLNLTEEREDFGTNTPTDSVVAYLKSENVFLQNFDKLCQHISLLKENEIIRFVSLEELYLESNQIQNLELSVFNNLTNLKIISLRNNSLTALKTHQFANLPLVSEIDVSRNNISLIEVDSFFNLPSLEMINLSRNKLKQLSVNFIDKPSKLKAVLLNENPWDCNESLCGLMDTVVRGALWGAEEVPTCAAPADLRGKHWHRAAGLVMPEITSNTTSVIEGHDLELECKNCFSSRLVWTLNDVKLPSNFVSSDSLTSTLIVKNVRKEQQGFYLCRVRSCEACEDAGLFVSVSGKPHSDFDVKQVLHVPGINSSESCSSRSGILVLHYTVAPTIELNTTHSN